MMCALNDSDFLLNYHTNNISESPEEPFTISILKRRNLVLSLAHSSQSLPNSTSCIIFEEQLKEYSNLVDDRNGINNFAKATLDLLSNLKNVSKSWKSGLPDSARPLDPLKGDCKGSCGSALPPPGLLPRLLAGPAQLCARPSAHDGGCRKPAVTPATHHQSTLDDYRLSNSSDQPQGSRGFTKKSSLYSTYQGTSRDSTNAEEAVLPINNFSSFKKNSSYPTTSEQNTAKRRPEFSAGREATSFEWKNKNKSSLYSNYSEESAEDSHDRSGNYQKYSRGRGGPGRAGRPIFTCGVPLNSCSSENDEEQQRMDFGVHFKTAKHELQISNQKKFGGGRGGGGGGGRPYPAAIDSDRNTSGGFQPMRAIKKSLGGKRAVTSQFVPPLRNNNSQESENDEKQMYNAEEGEEVDERLKNIEPRMIELIKSEIMDAGAKVGWDDIAGLEFAKTTIQEIVVWPMMRPDIFTGLRRPPKGILLFGPPGTGKTLIGKCIASQSQSTFFSISASSLTSKWIGDGEKMVRALFAVARCHQPAVVFIDEIDSLLSQRSDTEHESSRRLKTEFLVQLDGAGTGEDDRILVIGATNRPQELDEAARRRLVKRLYIPLPDLEARKQLTQNLVKSEKNDLTREEMEEIAALTAGYSGADMKNLCMEASLGPIRSISSQDMFQISKDQVRPLNISDFKMALRRVKSSVSPQDLEIYLKWDNQYGSGMFFLGVGIIVINLCESRGSCLDNLIPNGHIQINVHPEDAGRNDWNLNSLESNSLTLYDGCQRSGFVPHPITYLLVLSEAGLLEDLIEQLSCNHKRWWPRVWTVVLYKGQTADLEEAEDFARLAVQLLWAKAVYSLAVYIETRGLVYKADPFAEGNACGSEALNIHRSNCSYSPLPFRTQFPSWCRLHVSTRDSFPFSMKTKSGFRGYDVKLANLIATRSNLGIRWSMRPSQQSSAQHLAHAYYVNISQNDLDLAIGGSVISLKYFHNVTYARSHATQYLYFYVPDGTEVVGWKRLFAMFGVPLWLLILGTVVCTILVLTLFGKDSLSDYFLLVIGLLLEAAVRMPSGRLRILLLFIVFPFYYISSAYTIILHSYTMNPPSTKGILTLDQLQQANLTVVVSDTNKLLTDGVSVTKVRQVLSNIRPSPGLRAAAEMLHKKRDFCLAERDIEINVLISRNGYTLHHVDYKIATIMNSLVYPKGSKFGPRFHDIIVRSIESGFVNKWIQDEIGLKASQGSTLKRRRIGLRDVDSVFMLLGVGHLAALIAFLYEKCTHQLTRTDEEDLKNENKKQRPSIKSGFPIPSKKTPISGASPPKTSSRKIRTSPPNAKDFWP